MEPATDKLIPLHQGATITFRTPSGNTLTIREQNGADEEILSNFSEVKSGPDNVVKYLAAVTELDERLKRKPLVEDVNAWPLKDKYYALFRTRVLNFGYKVKFSHTCNNKHTHNFTEDMEEYDGDFFKSDYTPKTEWSVTKYPEYNPDNPRIHLNLSSGKEILFDILGGEGEKVLTSISPENSHVNMALRARNLQLNYNGTWITVKDFSVFGPRDMQEIRAKIKDMDGGFSPHTEVTCPTCKETEIYNIFFLPNFFYPTEI